MLTEKQKQKMRRKFRGHIKLFGKAFEPTKPDYIALYAFEMSDSTVKIGVSRQVKKRSWQVSNATGLEVLRVYQTDSMPEKVALRLERHLHGIFADRNARNEFFNITFEEAVTELDKLADEIALECEKAEQLFKDECEYFETLKKSYLEQSAPRDDQPKPACAYVLLMSNGNVKFGYGGNLRNSVTRLEKKTGLNVHDIYFTPFTSREIARFVEWVCQKKFSSRKVEGEFFSVDFNEACTIVDNFFTKAVHALPSVMKFECPAAIDF